jgi:hypothetical protein
MTKAELIKKMDEFVLLGNALDLEIKKQYGPRACLFHEADGILYAMSGDSTGFPTERMKFIEARANKIVRWGAGAW